MRRFLAMFVFCCTMFMWPLMELSAEQPVITAQNLQRAIADDPKAAETLYLNKTILINGIVVSKGISRYLTPTVTLSGSAEGPEMVICVLPRFDAGKLSDFQLGQSVTFSGRVQAMSRLVIMKECKVHTP